MGRGNLTERIMLADIQSKITQINKQILMVTPLEHRDIIKIRRLETRKQRLAIITLLPPNELDDDDFNVVYGEQTF